MFELKVTPNGITKFLLKIIAFLFAANLVSTYLNWVKGIKSGLGFVPMFDFDQEYNIPSLYSSLAILLSAAFLWLIAIITEKEKSKQEAIYWKVLSWIFIYLSLDELVSIHEQLSRVVIFFVGEFTDINDSRLWILPYVILLLLFFLYFVKFFFKLPVPIRIMFFISGFVYVSGAIGVELVGDRYMFNHKADFGYSLLSTLEETMEMIGIVLFLRALVYYIAKYTSTSTTDFRLNFAGKKSVNKD